MTWQCPKCLVMFREPYFPYHQAGSAKFRCEHISQNGEKCDVVYQEHYTKPTNQVGLVALVPYARIGPPPGLAMEEYSRHYEKDFPDATSSRTTEGS